MIFKNTKDTTNKTLLEFQLWYFDEDENKWEQGNCYDKSEFKYAYEELEDYKYQGIRAKIEEIWDYE